MEQNDCEKTKKELESLINDIHKKYQNIKKISYKNIKETEKALNNGTFDKIPKTLYTQHPLDPDSRDKLIKEYLTCNYTKETANETLRALKFLILDSSDTCKNTKNKWAIIVDNPNLLLLNFGNLQLFKTIGSVHNLYRNLRLNNKIQSIKSILQVIGNNNPITKIKKSPSELGFLIIKFDSNKKIDLLLKIPHVSAIVPMDFLDVDKLKKARRMSGDLDQYNLIKDDL